VSVGGSVRVFDFGGSCWERSLWQALVACLPGWLGRWVVVSCGCAGRSGTVGQFIIGWRSRWRSRLLTSHWDLAVSRARQSSPIQLFSNIVQNLKIFVRKANNFAQPDLGKQTPPKSCRQARKKGCAFRDQKKSPKNQKPKTKNQTELHTKRP
jgi:hypothetical protein